MANHVLQESPDFSLVLGGPLYQLFRRSHLSGAALELLHRRILFIPIFAWLPLLLLSLIGGHALGRAVKVPFLYDIEAHARFLVALPALIAAELIVHLRMRPAVPKFVERNIVVPEEMPKLHAAIDSAMQLRNSISLEVVSLVLVYTLGLWIWRSQILKDGMQSAIPVSDPSIAIFKRLQQAAARSLILEPKEPNQERFSGSIRRVTVDETRIIEPTVSTMLSSGGGLF